VVARTLGTGSEYGVPFNDPRRKYIFGMAVFDKVRV
jgi:hypothetical protein